MYIFLKSNCLALQKATLISGLLTQFNRSITSVALPQRSDVSLCKCSVLLGVHPYWIGDLDAIIMKTSELFPGQVHNTNGIYGNRKSLSQQLEFPSSAQQVLLP